MKYTIKRGLSDDSEPKNKKKVGDVVEVKVVDTERDKEAGVNLSKYNLNYVFQPKDPRDKKFKSVLKAPIDPASLPAHVDLSADGNWGNVFDQGELGSCVANSTAGCIRFVRKKEGRTVFDPSRLFIYYFGRLLEGFPINEDTGLYIRSGYKSVGNYSVCGENNWGYKPAKFTQRPSDNAMSAARQHKKFMYLALDEDILEVKKCLADGYPISFGFTVFESFMSAQVARTGQVPMPNFATEEEYGGHAVTIVGYDDATRTFKIANSWSADWGDNGFCYMPYDFVMNRRYSGDFWTARSFG